MYSTFDVVAERFIRTLKNKIYKYMTGISKNVYFDVLDDIVKYNNTVHITIKMKPIDITSDSNGKCNEYSNEKDPTFKVGDHVRNEVKNTAPWTNVISDLNSEEIVGNIHEKESEKAN